MRFNDLFIKKDTNTFISFLTNLGVKHTNKFSKEYFNQHPHKYSLYGLSKMLSDYGVENAGLKIEDKRSDIFNLEAPFVAYVGSEFITVNKITEKYVYFIREGENIKSTVEDFINNWTGIVLIGETNENSIEPGYNDNKKKELFGVFQKGVLILAISFCVLMICTTQNYYQNKGLILSLIVNLLGVYVGYMLVLKQLQIHSGYADKICSLFKQGDCNNVLESKAAKLMGLIGWSEIGLGYFISNTILLLFIPSLVNYMALINICSLPYTVWSIWYQKVKVQEWCVLCLVVQILLWALFFINFSFNYIYLPAFLLEELLWCGVIYSVPVLAISLLVPLISTSRKTENIIQELNSIKADENIFVSLLKKQPYYDVNKETSGILWGNSNAKILVTILTNPHCNPCSNMHKRLEKFLKDTNEICVQYIFSDFNDQLNSSSRFLSAIYYEKQNEERVKIYNEWFDHGKNNKKAFFEKYSVDIDSVVVLSENEKHRVWKQQMGLMSTPTILVNGYKLPDNYKIEDLLYFKKIDL